MDTGTPPKLGLALDTAAALAYVALVNLDRVALYPMSAGLGPGLGVLRGKGQIHPMLALLEGLRPEGRTDLRAAVTALLQRHRRRGVVVLISDFYDPAGWEEALGRLRYGRFEPVVVQITAPDEAAPALRGEVTLVDAETGEERAVTVTSAVAEGYRQRFKARQQALERFCHERGIVCVQVASDHPFEDLVLHVLRNAGILS
jgi:uncharacterized protein (DUF58 family)